jgi:hypothetical protein
VKGREKVVSPKKQAMEIAIKAAGRELILTTTRTVWFR